jgi:hypothetical protein
MFGALLYALCFGIGTALILEGFGAGVPSPSGIGIGLICGVLGILAQKAMER